MMILTFAAFQAELVLNSAQHFTSIDALLFEISFVAIGKKTNKPPQLKSRQFEETKLKLYILYTDGIKVRH